MIKYVLKQNKNSESNAYGKYYPYPVIEETMDLEKLAAHMAAHNSPYSKGTITGILSDMCQCIKELLLEGKNVKIADLAIFSLGIKSNGGADSEEEFSVTKNVKGLKLRARATGELISKNLKMEASLKRYGATPKTASTDSTDNSGGTVVENP